MKKLLSLLTSAAMVGIIFTNAAPASASCMLQFPIIGTVSSVQTDQYGNTRIMLAHPTAFNAALFPVTSTNIDQYNTLATTFKQNGYSLPTNYQYQNTYLPQGYASWNDYIQQNYNSLYVNASALNSISYQIGDIVAQGPPGGGACTQDGFTGFFGSSGTIQAAIASDSSDLSYTYGNETLSLTDTTPQYGCATNGSSYAAGTVCKVPVIYSMNGNSATLQEGGTKQFNGAHFKSVSLLVSTNTTLSCETQPGYGGGQPALCWVEDFSPRALLHVLTFGASYMPGLSATPSAGAAPLFVSFSTQQGAVGEVIDFGDGQRYTFTANDTPECAAPPPGTINPQCSTWRTSHNYTSAGTYTAILSPYWSCPSGVVCNRPPDIGTATITVTGNSSANFSATPTSGQAPLTVNFSSNTSGASVYVLNFGDGTSGQLYALPGVNGGFYGTSHTYQSAGTYTATLKKVVGATECYSCGDTNIYETIGSAVITVTGQNSGGLSISGISGPTQLQIGQEGNWGVQVNDSSGYLSYAVTWGDEYAPSSNSAAGVQNVAQNTGTFTHTYSRTGIFTPVFTVTNGSGARASASATVSVSSSISPPVPPPSNCPIIARNISRGSRGSDVLALQNYFISIGVLGSTSATGYFGPLTEGAVQEWQASHGIVSNGTVLTTGYGFVGPRTRAALARCKAQ